jgi:type II secretory pathway pseudopilin PulG
MMRKLAGCPAFSLVEVIVIIGVVAVLATVSVSVFQGVVQGAAESVALRNVNLLNGAIVAYNNANEEITIASVSGTTDEEQIIALLLQVDPDNLAGSPYLASQAEFTASSSSDRHRASWNGKFFQLVKKGTAGAGIDLEALGGSLGSTP